MKCQVRGELDHLLDDNENMAQLHLSRKLTKVSIMKFYWLLLLQ
jgi:hypothetical protein